MKHKTLSITTFIALLVLYLVTGFQSPFFWIVGSMIVLLFLGFLAYGVFQIKANYFVESINTGSGEGISLTFDDGPDPEKTPEVLSILEKEQVPAAFFVVGEKAEKHSEIVKSACEQGHVIGNHSYHHKYGIGFYSSIKLRKEIKKCNAVIEKICGRRPLFFRPPFGVTNPNYRRAISRLMMKSIGWTVRSFDTGAKDEQKLFNHIVKKIKPGTIILLHDTEEVTVKVLPGLIRHCKKNGIRIVSLERLIQQAAYDQV